MNDFVFLVVACLLTAGTEGKKDGYPVEGDNCAFVCFGYDNAYCDKLCKDKKADSGYCYWVHILCYCYGLPDKEPTKTNGRCKPGKK
uniref:Alpha-toxin TbTx5 n=2 Tax=Tityus TaxID=6886 RepID=SCX5_TITBA|nr:RecName: Full=Alpha-toxin TbTx5; AltName: Full=T-alpha* NaTx3.4; Flags: Precursor [Tityus bahiensis]